MALARTRTGPADIYAKRTPDSLKFPLPMMTAYDVKRDRFILDAEHAEYRPTGGNNRIRFKIPNTHLFDFRHGYLKLDLTVNGPASPNWAALSFGAYSIIKRLTISTPTVLEDLEEYNRWCGRMYEHVGDMGVALQVGELWGAQDLDTRKAAAAIPNKTYYIPLLSQFLNSNVIPAKYIRESIQIEFELAPPAECLESNTLLGSTTYSIRNAQLCFDTIVAPTYEQVVREHIETTGINFGFKTYKFMRSSPQSGQQYSLQISNRADSIDGIWVALRDQGEGVDIQELDKFITWEKRDLSTAQVQIGGTYFPQKPFDCTGDSAATYIELLRLLNIWKMSGILSKAPLISLANYNTNRYTLYFDFNGVHVDDLISAKTTSTMNVDLRLTLTHTVTPPNPLEAEIFVICFRSIKLNTNKVFELLSD